MEFRPDIFFKSGTFKREGGNVLIVLRFRRWAVVVFEIAKKIAGLLGMATRGIVVAATAARNLLRKTRKARN